MIPANLGRLRLDHADWLAALPELLADLAGRWSLRLGAPYEPGGTSAWVAPVTRADGSRAVLKVGLRHDEARDEAAGLRFWSGRGVVRVFESLAYDRTTALLLEECRPGTNARGPGPLADPAIDGGRGCSALAADPARFANRMAALLDLDAHRVRQYLFARCVIESQWENASRLAPTVDS